jgi:hypothetical protein
MLVLSLLSRRPTRTFVAAAIGSHSPMHSADPALTNTAF